MSQPLLREQGFQLIKITAIWTMRRFTVHRESAVSSFQSDQCSFENSFADYFEMGKMKNLGEIASLWRFPVKSMGGEQLQELDVCVHGILGDRAYALLDVATGKVASAKSSKLFPNLLQCRAEFVSPPRHLEKIPAVKVTFPDGSSVHSDETGANEKFTRFFGRQVKLIQTAPEDFTIDQFHPDLAGLDPSGNRNTLVSQKLGSALFKAIGMSSPVPSSSFLDVFPVSVITTSTLLKLKALAPESLFDESRFRMNMVVKTMDEGFVENSWVGQTLSIGGMTQLSVAMLDPRCVMTTLEQPGLPQDLGILRTLVAHNRVALPGMGNFPCAGVYAVVQTEGQTQVGNTVCV